MAGNIKGITIEFRGDTTKLDKALRQINTETRNLDKELKQVDKALKFNPTSVDLWRQKQQILTQKLEQTKDKLELLKKAQADMDARGVDKNSEEYRKLQREIIETESKVKTFEGQLRKIGNVNLRATSEQFKEMGNKLTAAGQAMQGLSLAAAAVAASIGAVTVKSASWADDINTMSKVYGIGTQELQKYSLAANLVDVSVETIAKSHIKLEKSMSSAADGTGATAEAFAKLGVDVTNADGSLRSGDAVWQDTITALGQMSNETERDALAMQLMGKSAAELNPLIEDGGETYKQLSETMAQYGLDFIDQGTLDKANQFNDSLDTIKSTGTLVFEQMGTQLAAYLAPAMERVVEIVGNLAQWFTNLSPETQALIATIAGVVAILAPLLIGLGKVSFAISSIMSLVATVGPAIGGVLATMGPIVAVIAAVVAAGILLYKNWDTIKAKASAIWNGIRSAIAGVLDGIKKKIQHTIATMVSTIVGKFNAIKSKVTTIWNGIKTAITKPIQTAVNLVKTAINKIKSVINGAKLKLPKIKLPHFSISGKFSLNPPSIPKISVDWYRKAERDPYMFGNATLFGAGEHNDEILYGRAALMRDIREAAGGGGNTVTINVTVNGADNPEDWARRLARQMQLEMRTI